MSGLVNFPRPNTEETILAKPLSRIRRKKKRNKNRRKHRDPGTFLPTHENYWPRMRNDNKAGAKIPQAVAFMKYVPRAAHR